MSLNICQFDREGIGEYIYVALLHNFCCIRLVEYLPLSKLILGYWKNESKKSFAETVSIQNEIAYEIL